MWLKTSIFFTLMCWQLSLPAQEKQLFLIAGQSNGVGQGNKDSSAVIKANTAFEYKYNSNSLEPLIDSFGEESLYFQKAKTGSIGPAFAKRLNETAGIESILVSAARRGSSCSYKAELKGMGTWDTKGEMLLFEKAVWKTKKAMAATSLPLHGIIWLQGERDANAINNKQLTPNEYAAALNALIVRFRNALGSECPFYIVKTGYYTGFPQTGFDAVRKVQEEISKKIKGVFVAYASTNSFREKGWMHDAIHYNQEGLNDIGKEVANFITQHQQKNQLEAGAANGN